MRKTLTMLRRQPLGAAGGVIVLVLIAVAVLAPRLAPHGPKEATFAPYLAPSAEFPMGTDQLGRDVLSRVIWGARLSLYVGLVSVLFGITAGSLWGAVTAYLGGAADTGSQRVVDSVMALPPIILALALMAALGQSVNNVIIALVVLLTPTAARTVRSIALGIIAVSLFIALTSSARLGLDLRGGTQLIYQGEQTARTPTITPEDIAMLIVKVDSSIAERVLRERWVEQARELYAKKYGKAAA